MNEREVLDSRRELLEQLEEAVQCIIATVKKSPNPESLHVDDWSAKDTLGHIAFWHESFARNASAMAEGRQPHVLDGKYPDLNRQGVERFRSMSVGQIAGRIRRAQAVIRQCVAGRRIKARGAGLGFWGIFSLETPVPFHRLVFMEKPMQPQFAQAGSQRWLQIAVNRAPTLLDEAFREAHAIDPDEMLRWCSPLASAQFKEYRDERAFQAMGIPAFSTKSLDDFWPRRGPVWDGLAVTNKENFVFVEAKAHIAEVHSPPSRAGEASRPKIQAALEEARKFYAPSSNKVWFEHYYQYCNRLAFHYFVAKVNKRPSKLVFLDFYNATEMHGPSSPDEWRNASKSVHAFLELPESLEEYGVFHAYMDVRRLERAVQSDAR